MQRRITLALTALLTPLAATACSDHPIKGVEVLTSAVCGEDSSVPVVRPKVMLVLDRSGSMTDVSWDHDDDPGTAEVTRWFSLHGVVEGLVTEHGDRLDLGATLFPAEGASKDTWTAACLPAKGPDVEVGEDKASEILAALPPANASLEGATPATASYFAALDHVAEIEGKDPRVMVLVTDGVANCGDGAAVPAHYDEALADAVRHAYEDLGIVTYVVGIGISTDFDEGAQVVPRDALDAVARQGGVARDGDTAYFDVADEMELRAALDEIASDLGCTLHLDKATDPERAVIMSVDGAIRDEVDDCSEDGWRWVPGSDGQELELCGQACVDYQRTGDAMLDYDCSF